MIPCIIKPRHALYVFQCYSSKGLLLFDATCEKLRLIVGTEIIFNVNKDSAA